MNRLIIFFLIIIIVVIVILYPIYVPYKIGLSKTVIIKQGDGVFDIADNLKKENIIKSKFHFIFYALITDSADKLKAGNYEFESPLNISKIVKTLTLGSKIKEIKITIPEGFNISQIENKFRENGFDISFELKNIKDFKSEFSFLSDAPENASLEGYLFPDTYLFFKDEPLDSIIKKFLNNFDKKLSPDLKEQIQKQNKKIFDIVIIASLIEKEVIEENDRHIVSGILWKRLKNNIPLQVDATITYITGKKTTKISLDDLKIDSLYNTYLYLGLPKGPIANPGLSSIKAAIFPKDTDYWFYLTTPDNRVIYSKNFEEHKKNKNIYLK